MCSVFFFNDTATTEIYTLSLHDALPIWVRFRELAQAEVDWYLASGEWRERAGGYAIQGRGAALVEEIRGDFWNVVGLPVPALLELAPELLTGRSKGS